jgi:hypothetical protein
MILEYFSQNYRRLSSAAAVCKEWQSVIEKRNFARLRLQCERLEDLDDFERIVSPRRDLVTYIGLNVMLTPYTCSICCQLEIHWEEAKNSHFVQQAVWKLLEILSSWKRTDKELTLELGAQSPSDSKHWFQWCYFGEDDIDGIINPKIGDRLQRDKGELHDPSHGWVEGQPFRTSPGVPALLRVYEKLEFRSFYKPPKVDAVTTLVIRRHCRRQFVPDTLSSLWSCFPRLEYMIYEPWRFWDTRVQKHFDYSKQTSPSPVVPNCSLCIEDYEKLFERFLPNGLKSCQYSKIPTKSISI